MAAAKVRQPAEAGGTMGKKRNLFIPVIVVILLIAVAFWLVKLKPTDTARLPSGSGTWEARMNCIPTDADSIYSMA